MIAHALASVAVAGRRLAPPRVGLLLLMALVLFGAALPLPLHSQDIQPVPALSGRVIDKSGTLTAPQQQALTAKLAALESETGSQVVILLVETTAPEDIAAYAQRVADQWKLGRREVGDGLLIVSAQGDRRIRIEVAKTLEGAIPDLAAKRIISERITPAFRAGDFAGGLNSAVDAIGTLIRGEALPPVRGDRAREQTEGGLDLGSLAMFFFVGVPIIGGILSAVLGRTLGSLATAGAVGGAGWWLTSSLLLAGAASVLTVLLVGVLGIGVAGSRRSIGPVIWGGGMGGGGWRGGGGGGGFGSGGGGDFGGGGASGNW